LTLLGVIAAYGFSIPVPCDKTHIANPTYQLLADGDRRISPNATLKVPLNIDKVHKMSISAGYRQDVTQPITIQIIDSNKTTIYNQTITPWQTAFFSPEKTGKHQMIIINSGDRPYNPRVSIESALTDEFDPCGEKPSLLWNLITFCSPGLILIVIGKVIPKKRN
jgi:hypothetical protein